MSNVHHCTIILFTEEQLIAFPNMYYLGTAGEVIHNRIMNQELKPGWLAPILVSDTNSERMCRARLFTPKTKRKSKRIQRLRRRDSDDLQ